MIKRMNSFDAKADELAQGRNGTKELVVYAKDLRPGDRMVLYRSMSVITSVMTPDNAPKVTTIKVEKVNKKGTKPRFERYDWPSNKRCTIYRLTQKAFEEANE